MYPVGERVMRIPTVENNTEVPKTQAYHIDPTVLFLVIGLQDVKSIC